MADRRPPRRKPGPRSSGRRAASTVGVRRVPDADVWELLHPRCAEERSDDLEEVEEMIEAEANEVAVDELRWLLGGCHDWIEGHRLLGALAVGGEGDVQLARGHYGIAYEIGIKALRRAGMPQPLPAERPANRPFFEAGKGLVHCLLQLDKREMAGEVVAQLVKLDPADPLGLRAMLERGDPPCGA